MNLVVVREVKKKLPFDVTLKHLKWVLNEFQHQSPSARWRDDFSYLPSSFPCVFGMSACGMGTCSCGCVYTWRCDCIQRLGFNFEIILNRSFPLFIESESLIEVQGFLIQLVQLAGLLLLFGPGHLPFPSHAKLQADCHTHIIFTWSLWVWSEVFIHTRQAPNNWTLPPAAINSFYIAFSQERIVFLKHASVPNSL